MEILTPHIEPTEPIIQIPLEPTEESPINAKNVELLALLDMKGEMYNKEVMDKVDYLTKTLSFDELSELAIRSGNDTRTSKLDKIFTCVKLSKMESEAKRKTDLIRNAKEQWLMKEAPQA